MNPKWAPKGTQNRLKSAKMLPRTPPGWVWRPSQEKGVSRTLLETPLCAENIAPAMVFTHSRGCPQARFGLHFGSIWALFWAPLAPKSRPRDEKEGFQKSIKKCLPKRCPKGSKMISKRASSKVLLASFLSPWTHLRPRWGPDPILAPFFIKKS